MHQEIQNYIKMAKEYGMGDTEIKKNLLDEGWEAKDVEDAFVQAKAQEQKLFENKDENTRLRKEEHKNAPALIEKEPKEKSLETSNTEKNREGIKTKTEDKKEPVPAEQPAQTESAVPSPKIMVDENHTKMIQKNKKFRKKLIIGIFTAIILITGGYFGYTYAFNNPSKIWDNFISDANLFNGSYNQNFKINYIDKVSDKKDSQGKNTKNTEASFAINSYIQTTDSKKTEMDSHISLKLASGETNFEQGLNFKMIGSIFYFKSSDIPQIKNLISQTTGKEADWIKIDINKLEDYSTNNKSILGAQIVGQNLLAQNDIKTATNDVTNKKESNKKLKNDFQIIWKNKKFWGVDKYIGSEKINGVKTAHFKNFFKKEEFKAGLDKSIDLIGEYLNKKEASDTKGTGQDGFNINSKKKIAETKNSINKFIDKIEIKKFETWIGFKNFRLYKFSLITNAPSLNSISNSKSNYNIPILSGARAKSRDAKRLADIRQIATALELYFEDKNGYPEGINGVPQNISPFYIGVIPKSPKPSDGVCGDYYNTYWYETKGQPISANGENFYSDYELSFCLGQVTGGYPAGIAKLTPKGIEGGIACKTENPNCQKKSKDNKKSFFDFPFTAELNIDIEFSDYGIKKEILTPKGALDIFKLLEPNPNRNSDVYSSIIPEKSNNDEKRLSDAKKLASVLEVYWNDNKKYPNSLNDLEPDYLDLIPKAPEPPAEGCSSDENLYSYIPTKTRKEYILKFCLGNGDKDFSPGLHTVSPTGFDSQ